MIERHVTTAISDAIVLENPVTEDTIELSVRRNRIRARLPIPFVNGKIAWPKKERQKYGWY
jgi:hypothetical protein